MSRIILIVICLLFANSGIAQSWFPDSARWHYSLHTASPVSGYILHQVSGDTNIANTVCKHIDGRAYGWDHINGQYIDFSRSQFDVYEDSGLVWINLPSTSAFDTLYNMNAAPGDSWQLPRFFTWNLCDSSSFIEVADTFTTVINGVSLKSQSAQIHFIDWQLDTIIYTDTIIERMGTTGVYMIMHDECNGWIDGQKGGPYRCYFDEDISHSGYHEVCDFIYTNVDELQGPRIALFPNPAKDRLFITGLSQATDQWVNIFDAHGRVALKMSASGESVEVDLSLLPSGIYHVRITGKQGKALFISKVVKETSR